VFYLKPKPRWGYASSILKGVQNVMFIQQQMYKQHETFPCSSGTYWLGIQKSKSPN